MKVLIEEKCEEHYNLLNKYFSVYLNLEKFLNKERYLSFCLRNDKNELVGVCLVNSFLTPKGKNIYRVIYTVVEKEYRGYGYNSLLLNSVYDYAQNNKIKYIIAHIRESNKSSYNSFIKNGYRLSNVSVEPYRNKEKKIRVVIFTKEETQSV